MNGSSGWRGAVPAFLTGVALSMLGVVASGLLLYGGPGFLPALSVILAVLLVSLAAGIVTDEGAVGAAAVEGARRLWLHVLLAYSLAAVFAVGWEIFRGYGALGITQGIGLAFLVALPFYSGGRILGHLAGLPGTRGRGRVASAALAGAAVGVLVVGYLFFPSLSPTAVILLSLVAVSGGALVHGWALDEVFWVDHAERRVGVEGVVEAERWLRGNPRAARLAIRENGRLRSLLDAEGEPVIPEDRAILALLDEWSVAWEAPRLLSVGTGAALLGEAVRRRTRLTDHRILATDTGSISFLLDSVRGFRGETGPQEDPGPERVEFDPSVFLHQGLPPLDSGKVDWILVDLLELAAAPGGGRLPPGVFARLQRHLRPGGILILVPFLEVPGGSDLTATLPEGSEVFSEVGLYVGGQDEGSGIGFPDDRGRPRLALPGGSRGAFLVAGNAPKHLAWPETVAGHLRVPGSGEPASAP